MPTYGSHKLSDFTYDAVFKQVMKDDVALRGVIERALGREVHGDVYVTMQREADPGPKKKAMRSDVYTISVDGTIYDLEMQRGPNTPIVPRMRGYQATLDVDRLQAGMEFDELDEVNIIFICTFDALGNGKAKTLLEMRDVEDPSAPINAGMRWTVLNSRAADLADSAELAALLNYIESDIVGDDELVKHIDELVRKVTSDEEVHKGMQMQDKYEREVRNALKAAEAEKVKERAEGIAEGIAEGQVKERGRIIELVSTLNCDESVKATIVDALKKPEICDQPCDKHGI